MTVTVMVLMFIKVLTAMKKTEAVSIQMQSPQTNEQYQTGSVSDVVPAEPLLVVYIKGK